MSELITQYAERFNENFPMFAVMGMDDDEIEAILRDCLEMNSPYRPPELDEKRLY